MNIKLMTYNIRGLWTSYKTHGRVVNLAAPDVCAVQEVRHPWNFRRMKKVTGMKGKFFPTVFGIYGLGMLWKKEKTGKPLRWSCHRIKVAEKFPENHRGYIAVEFKDFVYVCTHMSLDVESRARMAEMILMDPLVTRIDKPVFVAGDLNEHLGATAGCLHVLEDDGFVVVNNTKRHPDGRYEDFTRTTGTMIDLIYGRGRYRIVERGVLFEPSSRWTFLALISDHCPYVATVAL